MAANMENGSERRGNLLRIAVWSTAACLLLLPLVAMQFTSEVNWTGLDFAVFGIMLLVACSTYEVGVRMSRDTFYRAGVGVAALAGFFLVWINIAVGIIGSEHNRANLMFFGVLAVGLVGALIARLRAAGMVHALITTAVAQALVLVGAQFTGSDPALLPLTVCFTGAWLVSAALFWKAAQR
ncbi:hypothetical protein [Arenimonas oryziterrae]|uniref:Uncharacterized protein n=1 Tax=Arenimonas oryziterrae DSM 21050 = YC6267 TaxID=1121015 RepID=A0A091BIJ2_9GAMM|nr:hypothetical protein [Arenimonas oryziterrae]KFN44165.1 hypothetical protein N789_07040 [Arenimonas oryziterrae DSM 21050 = YC6267]